MGWVPRPRPESCPGRGHLLSLRCPYVVLTLSLRSLLVLTLSLRRPYVVLTRVTNVHRLSPARKDVSAGQAAIAHRVTASHLGGTSSSGTTTFSRNKSLTCTHRGKTATDLRKRPSTFLSVGGRFSLVCYMRHIATALPRRPSEVRRLRRTLRSRPASSCWDCSTRY